MTSNILKYKCYYVTGTKQDRQNQLEAVTAALSALEARLDKSNQDCKVLQLLESVTQGIYDEIDKLTKKAPADNITDLALEQINDVIRETKEIAEDVYVQRLKEFIPAGDNPQHRDAVMVVRQVREGLKRFDVTISRRIGLVVAKIAEARLVRVALLHYARTGDSPDTDAIKSMAQSLSYPFSWATIEPWMKQYGPDYDHSYEFLFEKLDNLDIASHFNVE